MVREHNDKFAWVDNGNYLTVCGLRGNNVLMLWTMLHVGVNSKLEFCCEELLGLQVYIRF